jgi:anaerobic ribonucleoside-triphosphate reductase activating protein
MMIAINKAHFPVTVLGPGQRLAIWFQGCSIGCKGCVSLDTWPADSSREVALADLIDWCRSTTRGALGGVTLSGGEPFDQPEALAALLDELNRWRSEPGVRFDILCYSGYPLAHLRRVHPGILARLDAIIAEPFVENLPVAHVWRGSSNQTLVPLSALGEEVFGPHVLAPAGSLGKRIQMKLEAGRIWYIGIPERGDMDALEAACAEQGVRFASVSWRQ